MSYRVVFKKSVLKDVRPYPKRVVERMREVVEDIQQDPFSSKIKKLTGNDDIFRYRFGNYRVLYQVDTQKEVITILRVAHQKNAYQR